VKASSPPPFPPDPEGSGAAGPDHSADADSREDLDVTRRRWSFLADASRRLADSLDVETTLETIANLSLPHLGSWSIVDLTEEDGSVRRLTIVHPDEEMQIVARELKEGWPPDRDDPLGIPAVARTGQSEVVEEVTDELLVEVARSEDNLRHLRVLGMKSLMTVPLRARGAVLGAITFIASSTDRSYQKEDLSLAEDLAERCALALANARLHRSAAQAARAREAQLRAETSDQIKDDFLSTVSHELRTPLHAISGYVELLAMNVAGPLNRRQREFVERIEIGGQQLLMLVEDMLNFVRLSSGQVEYDLTNFSLGSLVDDVAGVYRPVIEEKEISLSVDCETSVRAYADPPKVWQIILNLLSNARKATEPGGSVTVRCSREDDWAIIRVEDTGCGIPEERIPRIFEPFEQADSGLTRTSEGIGLGLSISRHLAQGMNGDLTVSSEEDEGCVFTVSLPLARDENHG